jgi:hypothetical protein
MYDVNCLPDIQPIKGVLRKARLKLRPTIMHIQLQSQLVEEETVQKEGKVVPITEGKKTQAQEPLIYIGRQGKQFPLQAYIGRGGN